MGKRGKTPMQTTGVSFFTRVGEPGCISEEPVGGSARVRGGVCLLDAGRESWALFMGLVLVAGVYGYVCVVRSMALYLVTSRRVEIIHGLITKSSNEVRVKDIRTINVKKSGFKGLLGVGDVEFSSAGWGWVGGGFPRCLGRAVGQSSRKRVAGRGVTSVIGYWQAL